MDTKFVPVLQVAQTCRDNRSFYLTPLPNFNGFIQTPTD